MSRAINPFECFGNRISFIRGQMTLLDYDLAKFYGKTTRHVSLAVKKHIECFPPEIMFRLTRRELSVLRSQFVINKRQSPKLAFTRRGVTMLLMILNGEYPFKKNQDCGKRCIIYSRDFSFVRPVSHWITGKQEEFKDRRCFVIPPLKTITKSKRKKK